jgi:hypothetical protein
MAPSFAAQLKAAQLAPTMAEAVARMNMMVTEICPMPKRSWWRLGMRPPRHKWVDQTKALNTFTYTTMDRCERCGICVLGHVL